MIASLLAAAWAQDPEPTQEEVEADREADLFGTPAPAPDDTDTTPAPEPEPVFESSEGAMQDTLSQLDDRLTVGGRLWQRAQANVPDGVGGPDEVTLDSPTLLDLFVDARANDRVRAYARGRLQHDWSIRAGDVDPFTGEPIPVDTVLLDQLWLKWDIAHRVFFTAGRQRIRWGAGRFWNPTDFLNQQRLDPLAILDLRTGVDLLKVHVPFEAAGANVYAVANLADAQALDQIGGALRAEWVVGTTEITASGALRKDQPVLLGADLSSGVGPLDVRIESAFQHGVTTPGWEGRLNLDTLTFPTEVDRSDRWLVQVVAGVELGISLSTEDSITFGLEAFHNELGYDSADLLPWLFLQGQYTPLYFGRDYGAAYVFLPGPGTWDDQTFTASVLSNLSDRSAVARFDWRGTVLTWLEPNAFVQWHFGDNGELYYSVEIPALAPGDEPVTVPAPLLELGVGALLRF